MAQSHITRVRCLCLSYHRDMARGWESKSVEEQQSAADLTASGALLDAAKRNVLERAKRARQKQELDLQRERISPSVRRVRCAGPHWKQPWPTSNPAWLFSPKPARQRRDDFSAVLPTAQFLSLSARESSPFEQVERTARPAHRVRNDSFSWDVPDRLRIKNEA